MKKLVLIFAVLTAFLLGSTPAVAATLWSQAPYDLTEISEYVQESLVRIECFPDDSDEGWIGSGWVIDQEMPEYAAELGYKSIVITAAHVIEECSYDGTYDPVVRVGNTWYDGAIWDYNEEMDLASLVIEAEVPGLTIYGETPRIGWWNGILGSPLGIDGVLSTGNISYVQGDELLSTAAISPGSSGGPVFDRTGRVLGTVSATLIDGQNMNYIVGAQYICEFVLDCGPEEVWQKPLVIKNSVNVIKTTTGRAKVIVANVPNWYIEIYVDGKLKVSRWVNLNVRSFNVKVAKPGSVVAVWLYRDGFEAKVLKKRLTY